MPRRIYPKPPIVEALMEFRFMSAVDARSLAEQLRDRLGERYDAPVTQFDLFQLQATAHAGGGMSTAATRQPDMFFLSSASGHRRIGCGSSVLTIHTLAPYPGWESFVEQAADAIAALPASVAEAQVGVLAIRYIDLIRLPLGEAIVDYIPIVPPCPAAMPPHITNYQYLTQTQDPDDGTTVQLMVAMAPSPTEEDHALWLDLALTKRVNGMSFLELAWLPEMEILHGRLRDIFETSITDAARELFQ
ncbi:MAG: TIGR04255 family protein [Planctomycetales bacterium]|nr:TIGR04255 family protein [Planctomycetales bacterium]